MPTFIAAEIYSESSFDNLAKMDRQYSLPFSKSHICQLLQNVKEKEDSNQYQVGSKQVHTLPQLYLQNSLKTPSPLMMSPRSSSFLAWNLICFTTGRKTLSSASQDLASVSGN